MESRDNQEVELSEALVAATQALYDTRKEVPLGSTNIKVANDGPTLPLKLQRFKKREASILPFFPVANPKEQATIASVSPNTENFEVKITAAIQAPVANISQEKTKMASVTARGADVTEEKAAVPSAAAKTDEEAKKVREGKKDVDEPNEITYSPKTQKFYTDKIVLLSPLLQVKNFKNGKTVDALVDVKSSELAKINIDKVRERIQEFLQKTQHMDTTQRRVLLRKQIAELASQFGTGNCEELTTIAFLMLINNDYKGKIEFVSCRNIDHVFVVLNRPEASDPKNWKTWGPYTVVLDPWIFRVFTADKFDQVWKNNTLRMDPSKLETFVKFDDSSFRKPVSSTNPKRIL